MSRTPNPYAPPKNEGAAPISAEVAAHEATRREHLNAETNIKTIGFLLYLGAFGCLANGLLDLSFDPVVGMTLILTGTAMGWSGHRLRRLDPRGRTVYTVIAALLVVVTLATNTGDIGFQLGQMFWPVLMVALLWVSKASFVMTAHYREVVVPATPHIKYRTSPLALLLVVVLIGVLIAVIAMNL